MIKNIISHTKPASQCAAQRRLNISKNSGSAAPSLPSTGTSGSNSSFLQTLWDEFRQNNGIMVLLKLVQIQVSKAEGFLSSALLGGASTVIMIIIPLY